uniref:Uncharacterized protein n=1 Tax=Triticum urartu TaxID=4572 RepID=A0A8R7TVE9_TRIUA
MDDELPDPAVVAVPTPLQGTNAVPQDSFDFLLMLLQKVTLWQHTLISHLLKEKNKQAREEDSNFL